MEYGQFSQAGKKILKQSKLYKALEQCKPVLMFSFWFSAAINILMLFMPVYTSQVLDRVLSSGSYETLIMLTIITLIAFACSSTMELCRSTAMSKLADWIDNEISPEIISQSVALKSIKGIGSTGEAIRDIGVLKGLISGNVMFLLFDAPWSILYLIAIFAIHPATGFIALIGAILLFSMALWNELSTKHLLQESNETLIENTQSVDAASRNAEVVEAMGMSRRVIDRWAQGNKENRLIQLKILQRSGFILAITRFIRMSLQIAVMGVGTALAIMGLKSTGGIIAASILMGKALSPFENAISAWKTVSSAMTSYKRLQMLILSAPKREQSMELPTPDGNVTFDKVFFTPFGAQKPTIKGVSFSVQSGEIVAVIGSSASGKSTLAKLLVGVWKPIAGNVRLDGANVYTWNRESFGKYVGYLPQDVELFNATVKENIAKMQHDPNPEKVIEAAKITGIHEMILSFPSGYDTIIGNGAHSVVLSGGQKQLIGLTRALYNNPRVLVLDEPNSNLDNLGDLRLMAAIAYAKKNKVTTFIITHKLNALHLADKIIIMHDGAIREMGDRDEIIARISERSQENSQKERPNNNESDEMGGGSSQEQPRTSGGSLESLQQSDKIVEENTNTES